MLIFAAVAIARQIHRRAARVNSGFSRGVSRFLGASSYKMWCYRRKSCKIVAANMHFVKRSSSTLIIIFAVWLFQSPAFACALEDCNISAPEDSSLRVASDLDGDLQTDR